MKAKIAKGLSNEQNNMMGETHLRRCWVSHFQCMGLKHLCFPANIIYIINEKKKTNPKTVHLIRVTHRLIANESSFHGSICFPCIRNVKVNPCIKENTFNQPLSSQSNWLGSLPSKAESMKTTDDRFSGLYPSIPLGCRHHFYALGNNSSRGSSSVDNF